MVGISVIIPVYNVEDYLSQCLDSICNQTFKDIEIICVNDGSIDNSLDILNEYAESDRRIKIINQHNQGLAASRNQGLKEAKGDYVYFIDSDDYIELDALEKLHENIVTNSSDMVLFKFQKVDDYRNVHKRGVEFKIDKIFGDIDYGNFTFTYKDVKRHVMNSAFSACLKLYRRDFIEDISFPIGLNFEDVPVHVKLMLEAESLSFVPEFLYNYRSNPDSILNSSANGFDIFKVIDMVEEYLKENGHYEELENEFIFFKIAQILVYLKSERSDEYFKRAKDEFEKITIKDEKTLKKYALKGYNRVLSYNNYSSYERKNKKPKGNKKSKTFSKKVFDVINRII
ncbi:glycosyltransferase family 2 protein [Methanobrevibacter thaueri]|uniref:Putative glycosyltransferase EpsJ n=1 Tax=Methanobrevibacter thaueri TaxID=190975 RepID=A0A315XQP8_9EURY|nr:glycosyltransferase family 2 protein [Methanobrevibacter thaueri]PWB88333.1 putative glycosyltransferase EpsJ [Methanobrevibacter thaueri]